METHQRPLFQHLILIVSCWFRMKFGLGESCEAAASCRLQGEPGEAREKSPASPPHRTAGTALPGNAGVPPASCSFGRRRASVRCCRQPPCLREPHRPGRRRAMVPFPVDPSGGDGRGCARLGAGGTPALPGSHHCAGGTPALPGSRHRAGGTPALPGSLHPMTSSHQGHQIADAFWCRLWLKEVYLSSGLFVSIRVHSWFVFINDRLFFLE